MGDNESKNRYIGKITVAIRSVTQHDINFWSKRRRTLPTRSRNARKNCKISVIVAKSLLSNEIFVLYFLKQFDAHIDISQNLLSSFNQGNTSVHELFQGKGGYRSVSVILAQDIVISARSESRIQCNL